MDGSQRDLAAFYSFFKEIGTTEHQAGAEFAQDGLDMDTQQGGNAICGGGWLDEFCFHPQHQGLGYSIDL